MCCGYLLYVTLPSVPVAIVVVVRTPPVKPRVCVVGLEMCMCMYDAMLATHGKRPIQ